MASFFSCDFVQWKYLRRQEKMEYLIWKQQKKEAHDKKLLYFLSCFASLVLKI